MKLNLAELRKWVGFNKPLTKDAILQLLDIAEVAVKYRDTGIRAKQFMNGEIEDGSGIDESQEWLNKLFQLLEDVEVSDV